MKMLKLKNGEDSGWALTETICTLVVMAVITICAFWGFVDLRFKYFSVKMTDLVTVLASNVQTKFMGYPNYEGVNTSKIKDMGIIPSGLKYNKAKALHHYMGGRLDVFAVDDEENKLPAEFFAVRLQNLSPEMCMELGSIKWDNNMSSGLIAMEIVAKPDGDPKEQIDNMSVYCTGIDADLFASPNRGYAMACKNGTRQSFPIKPRYAWKACNCTENTCMITWIYK